MSIVTAAAPSTGSGVRPFRVMVVDDSGAIRGLIGRWIEAESDMVVVASLRTGLDAVTQIERVNPDIVVLDIEMPEMDGISALPLLLAKKPNLIVIIVSTLTRRNAEISFRALSLGAIDYIPKPESARDPAAVDTFRRDLVQRIRQFGARLRRPSATVASPPLAPASGVGRAVLPAQPRASLRPLGLLAPRVLLIGSSTGGPQALMALMAQIGPVIDRVPVLITQHMPATFTAILAEHLGRASGRPAREGSHGDIVKAGNIYLAPGGRHMRVVRKDSNVAIALDDGPPVNFCRPAVDPLFASAVNVWKGATLAVILTGMGSDGMRGGKQVVAAGGCIIAQDEASSVVWGMPGAAAHAGICAAILPLGQIGPTLVRLFTGHRP